MDLQLLRALELDLTVEHAGHRVQLTGADGHFVARFAALTSVLHFARLTFPARKHFPRGLALRLQWRGLAWRVRS